MDDNIFVLSYFFFFETNRLWLWERPPR